MDSVTCTQNSQLQAAGMEAGIVVFTRDESTGQRPAALAASS